MIPESERSIVLYQGSPIERVDTRTLAFPEGRQGDPRYFVPEDIVVSQYGVIGFLIVDKTPEQRWYSYDNSEWTGVEVRNIGPDQNPSHFLNTDAGFKMIRYFMLPPTVGNFFARDRFLGEPMIDKCCREGTLPDEFDEIRADTPGFAFGLKAGYLFEEHQEFVRTVAKASFPDLTDEELDHYDWGKNQYTYLSFHPWQDFKHVISRGMESLLAAMNNFDTVIERFDSKRVLTPRDLLADNPNPHSYESSPSVKNP